MPSFTISGYQFHVPTAHKAGDTLSVGEAQALDALRAERIQQNMRSVVQAELAKLLPNEQLSPEQLAELRQQIIDYANRFTFVEQHRPSALEREIEAIARQRAAEYGMAFESVIGMVASDPAVTAEAQRRLDAKSAAVTLAELF